MTAHNYYTHGHSGHVEHEERLAEASGIRRGSGLHLIQKQGTQNWVHYAIPTVTGLDLTYLRLHYTVEHATISAVHLWDGNKLFLAQEVGYGGEAGKEQHVTNSLGGSQQKFEIHRALGVSLRIEASADHDGSVIVHGVGAQLED